VFVGIVVSTFSFSFLVFEQYIGCYFFLFLDHATKLIAKIRRCEIIVRDANRNHHFFPNGKCSCQDHFWHSSFFLFVDFYFIKIKIISCIWSINHSYYLFWLIYHWLWLLYMIVQ
jgi:hypothetical protein